ncbi:MAG: hypothetical protein CVU69_04620 [Deltaproteobacteria bacterium HGW-Deltaproteobacteria-4]|nr:MAG: hypothetical protein CVU69_04620 [Deltaproteobacteria bacterium HGW-Deltaproteobacteria-4]
MGSGKVAVPYYGSLYRSKVGYERIYFIVEDGTVKDKDLDVRLCVWDNKTESTLPEWLKSNRIKNLVCREDPDVSLKNAILDLGIEIRSGADNNALRLMKSLLV